jgi:hypothetical protein
VTLFVAVLGALLALLVPLAFVAGLKLGALKSSSKLEAATSTLKALGQRLEKLEQMESQTKTALSSLLAVSDRMDLTLAKVAEWTVMAPGRKRITPQDPVDRFIARSHSALPSVPLYPEPEDSGLATLVGPTERGPG